MAKKKDFAFAQIQMPTTPSESTTTDLQKILSAAGIIPSDTPSKVTFDCPNPVLEQMKDYGYWEGLSQRDVILEALELLFSNKIVKARPDKVKNRKKVGRKPNLLKIISS